MKQLFSAFYRKLEETDMSFERYLKSQIDWSNRLTAITGEHQHPIKDKNTKS
ncbi:MAG: hypothetical protein LBD45_04110 [Bacteroidales bacterium]|jgi:hypothetical protein|nr:hypothetical protein [Bacteroidales bacterium]